MAAFHLILICCLVQSVSTEVSIKDPEELHHHKQESPVEEHQHTQETPVEELHMQETSVEEQQYTQENLVHSPYTEDANREESSGATDNNVADNNRDFSTTNEKVSSTAKEIDSSTTNEIDSSTTNEKASSVANEVSSPEVAPIVVESGPDNGYPDTTTSPKLFSLTSILKTWISSFLQEFQEGLNIPRNQNISEISNVTVVPDANSTEIDNSPNNLTESGKRVKFNCTGRNVTENTTAVVQIVNSTVLYEFLNFDKNTSSTDCVVIMFYAPWCKFCAKTAPHYNALGRAFPQLDVLAVDAVHFSNLNARFGTVSVPNIMIFHSSRSAVRFNHTERTFDKMVEFVKNVTGLEPSNITDHGEGPLSSVQTHHVDYLLWCAWLFIIVSSSHICIKSSYGQTLINQIKILWNEHQHIE